MGGRRRREGTEGRGGIKKMEEEEVEEELEEEAEEEAEEKEEER